MSIKIKETSSYRNPGGFIFYHTGELFRQINKSYKINYEYLMCSGLYQNKAPLLYKTKSEIVELSNKLKAPLHLTWSCYQFEDKACGKCESCLIRLKGFKQAGIKDPIEYVFL